jgi:hypothetical protein
MVPSYESFHKCVGVFDLERICISIIAIVEKVAYCLTDISFNSRFRPDSLVVTSNSFGLADNR